MPRTTQAKTKGNTKASPINVAGKWELIMGKNKKIELRASSQSGSKGKIVSNNKEIGTWELSPKGSLALTVSGGDMAGNYSLKKSGVSPLSFAGNWTDVNGNSKAVEMNFVSKS